ncbi:hypothetical protein [Streptomyces sp. NPDC057557]|uniref:hypothetical protein n=1 Tax=Streptomyces sp. NPDC057557 TaxID=3346167 RepID=UPI0036B35F1A
MICPACAASLTGKERTGRVCARCGKRFALDPAVHGTGMHDIRIRRIAKHATDHGRLKITLTQLWYLSRTRNYAWAEQDPQGVPTGIRWLVALPVAVALLLCAVLTGGVLAFVAGAAGCVVLVVASAMRHLGAEGTAGRSDIVAGALEELAEYPSALPVVVLHDADPLGVLLAPLIRAAQRDRVVVDAGLPVSAARGKQGVVRLARHDRFADAEQLRAVAGLPEADAKWLADGFWSPIAVVPPRLLESIVVRAVERALTTPPPGPRYAHTNGFLTWPQAPQTAQTLRARDIGRPGAGPSTKEGTSSA